MQCHSVLTPFFSLTVGSEASFVKAMASKRAGRVKKQIPSSQSPYNTLHHFSLHIGEAKIPAGVVESQTSVIHSQ